MWAKTQQYFRQKLKKTHQKSLQKSTAKLCRILKNCRVLDSNSTEMFKGALQNLSQNSAEFLSERHWPFDYPESVKAKIYPDMSETADVFYISKQISKNLGNNFAKLSAES